MYNLVLIYTPFNKLVIKALIDQGLLHKNSLIIDHTNRKSKDFTNYIHLSNIFKKLYFIAKIKFFSSFFLKKYLITDFFIPHADGVVSNMLVKMVKKSNYFNLNLYHEGILSLYNENENPKSIKLKKYFIALFFFQKHDYKSDLFPIDISKSFYTPFKKNSTHIPRHKIINFSLPDHRFNLPKKNHLLFIGQPNYFKREIFKKTLLKILRDNNIDNLIYKPHPVELNYIIDKNDFENINFIDKNIAIETLASELSPQIVVSGLSSALIHLHLNNSDLKFYSIVPTGSEIYARKSIIKVFKEIGINII
jgi:hypothetical protein